MTLFVITSAYPNRINGGAGIFVREQCQTLAKMGYSVVVLDVSGMGYRHWAEWDLFKVNEFQDDNCYCYALHYRALMEERLPRRADYYTRKCADKLYKLAVKERGEPDCLIGHFTFTAGSIAAEIALREKKPCIVVEHYSMYLQERLNEFIRRRLIYTVENSRYVCVSNELKNAIIGHTKLNQEIDVIPNMVSDMFTYYPPIESNSFVFFGAGNLTDNKRFGLLIDAFCKAFRQDEKDVSLQIAGDGPEKEKLQGLILERNRQEQIQLLGRCSQEKMLEKYKMCNSFVLLSKHETFGIVYREAMAVGRPIIATRNGGIQEEWDDSQGILLTSDAVTDVARALRYMRTIGKKYNARQLSFRCRSLYASEVVMEQYNKLIIIEASGCETVDNTKKGRDMK